MRDDALINNIQPTVVGSTTTVHYKMLTSKRKKTD